MTTHAVNWWLAHAPADRVGFWGFDDAAVPDTNRDTSGTAIAAAALLKLAALAPEEPQRARYQAAAEATVTALVERSLDARGILSHGCYNKRINLATQNELIGARTISASPARAERSPPAGPGLRAGSGPGAIQQSEV